MQPVKRREFLKVLGATTAAASATACLPEDTGKLIPYLARPNRSRRLDLLRDAVPRVFGRLRGDRRDT